MEERRISPYLTINQPANLTIGESIRPIPCTVEDISLGGIRVSLGKYLFPEVFSDVSLSLTDNFNLDIGASVMWQESVEARNTYGLSFTRIDDEDRNRIAQFVNSGLETEKKDGWWKGI